MKNRMKFLGLAAACATLVCGWTAEATHCQIRGRVFNRALDGPALSGWRVMKTPIEGFGMDTVTTNAAGEFAFVGLPGAQTYSIRAEVPPGWYAVDAKAGVHEVDGEFGAISTSTRIDNNTLDVWVAEGCVNGQNYFAVANAALDVPYRSFSPGDLAALTGVRVVKPTRPGKGLPNVANVLADIVELGGFSPKSSESDVAGGLRVGISFMVQVSAERWRPDPAYKKTFAWMRLTKWNISSGTGRGFGDIQKTLVDRTGLHTRAPHGLDSLLKLGKPYLAMRGEYKSLQPRSYNSRLLAQLIALKVNIVASQLGITPYGFGELRYTEDNPLNGLLVREISARADSAITFWKLGVEDLTVLDTVITKINGAFRGPITAAHVIVFEAGGNLELDGARALFGAPFLRPSGLPPRRIAARRNDMRESREIPEGNVLLENYPNPFNPTTSIPFQLAAPGTVTLEVFNVLGQRVATLLDREEMGDGLQEVEFDASGLTSGVYWWRLAVADPATGEVVFNRAKRMMLLK